MWNQGKQPQHTSAQIKKVVEAVATFYATCGGTDQFLIFKNFFVNGIFTKPFFAAQFTSKQFIYNINKVWTRPIY